MNWESPFWGALGHTFRVRPTGGQFRTCWRPYWRWSGRGRLPAFEVGFRRTITREYVEVPEGWSPSEKPNIYTVTVPDEHCIRLELR